MHHIVDNNRNSKKGMGRENQLLCAGARYYAVDPPEPVYNIEVAVDHVYRVTAAGVFAYLRILWPTAPSLSLPTVHLVIYAGQARRGVYLYRLVPIAGTREAPRSDGVHQILQ